MTHSWRSVDTSVRRHRARRLREIDEQIAEQRAVYAETGDPADLKELNRLIRYGIAVLNEVTSGDDINAL